MRRRGGHSPGVPVEEFPDWVLRPAGGYHPDRVDADVRAFEAWRDARARWLAENAPDVRWLEIQAECRRRWPVVEAISHHHAEA